MFRPSVEIEEKVLLCVESFDLSILGIGELGELVEVVFAVGLAIGLLLSADLGRPDASFTFLAIMAAEGAKNPSKAEPGAWVVSGVGDC